MNTTPNSRRYFYTDPLAAAWMAKHFGMKICSDYREFPMAKDAPLSDDVIMIQVAFAAMGTLQWRKFPIHPDSLHLLEPQVGDLIEGINPIFIENDEECQDCLNQGMYKILQRNGIPFMWPECESI